MVAAKIKIKMISHAVELIEKREEPK